MKCIYPKIHFSYSWKFDIFYWTRYISELRGEYSRRKCRDKANLRTLWAWFLHDNCIALASKAKSNLKKKNYLIDVGDPKWRTNLAQLLTESLPIWTFNKKKKRTKKALHKDASTIATVTFSICRMPALWFFSPEKL